MSWWEFQARVSGYNAANGLNKTQAPSHDEFMAALARDDERQALKGR